MKLRTRRHGSTVQVYAIKRLERPNNSGLKRVRVIVAECMGERAEEMARLIVEGMKDG